MKAINPLKRLFPPCVRARFPRPMMTSLSDGSKSLGRTLGSLNLAREVDEENDEEEEDSADCWEDAQEAVETRDAVSSAALEGRASGRAESSETADILKRQDWKKG